MSYFPTDIPFMSDEELKENGIRIPAAETKETDTAPSPDKAYTDTDGNTRVSESTSLDGLEPYNDEQASYLRGKKDQYTEDKSTIASLKAANEQLEKTVRDATDMIKSLNKELKQVKAEKGMFANDWEAYKQGIKVQAEVDAQDLKDAKEGWDRAEERAAAAFERGKAAGADEVWNAISTICRMGDIDRTKVFGETWISRILSKYGVSEVIDKIRTYEEQKMQEGGQADETGSVCG